MTERPKSWWWLAAEPLGDDVAWALTRVRQGAPRPTGPVDAGLWSGMGPVRDLAATARPTGADDLWTGPLADPRRERDLAVELGRELLPQVLRRALSGIDPELPDTVTVAVRGWLARVPWDLLAIDHRGTRLVEAARVLGGLPATLGVGRARRPDTGAAGPTVRVVDPGPLDSADGWTTIYPQSRPPVWRSLLAEGERIVPAGGDGLTVERFGALLRRGRPSRLTYFGHAVAGTDHAPASAALVLTDEDGDTRLFTAFDWLSDPAALPAPPRVAVIGCGSDDSEVAEQSGLPIAAINAGAALVTATRWVLPRDRSAEAMATTGLAVAVDRAHGRPDPVGALRAWQLDRLDAWREHGGFRHTPLLWAAPVTYLAPDSP